MVHDEPHRSGIRFRRVYKPYFLGSLFATCSIRTQGATVAITRPVIKAIIALLYGAANDQLVLTLSAGGPNDGQSRTPIANCAVNPWLALSACYCVVWC